VTVLLVGGGGREHALAWKLRQDDPALELIAAPGNPGIATLARCVAIAADDVDRLAALARAERASLVVIGPEGPLAGGLADRCAADGIAAFGPTASAARIETSKTFAKELMRRAGVPTAHATTHDTVESALAAVAALGTPVVIKASGLAAGKGVIVAQTAAEAERAVRDMLEHRAFGDAGREVLVEEFMGGEELSLFAICDGEHALMLEGAQDHKRLCNGDTGPNTGGMGAYTPVSLDTAELRARVAHEIFTPTLAALRDAGAPFRGLLYAGLMLTQSGPRVVEFNARFGDPETQALLPRLTSPLLGMLRTVAGGGSLRGAQLAWRQAASVTTVLAADGYPEHPRTGDPISFPDPVDDVYVFHAGTRVAPGAATAPGSAVGDPPVVTAGGRVLAVTALAPTLALAAQRSRDYADGVDFAGKQLRTDIAWRDLRRSATPRRA